MTNIDSILKSRDIILLTKVHIVKARVLPVVMYRCEIDHNESWVQKNWCFWTVVLEKTLESPLDCKEIQPVNPKGNQSWIFIGRTNSEAETPILRPPDAKKLTHLERPWCWERLKAGGEGDNRVWDGGWHHRLYVHEFKQAPGVGDAQGSLVCYSPWGFKESDKTLNWTELIYLQPKLLGKHRHSYQGWHFKGLEISFQKPRAMARPLWSKLNYSLQVLVWTQFL